MEKRTRKPRRRRRSGRGRFPRERGPAPGERSVVRNVLLAIFSAFIVFHLAVIVISPNSSSYPGRAFSWLLQPYGAALGLNTPWNFFSPDPAHTMYLRLQLHWQNEDGSFARDSEELFFPRARDLREMDLSKRRELYAMRYLMLDPRRVEALFGPWVCGRYQGLSNLTVEHIVQPIPDLDKAARLSVDSWRTEEAMKSFGRVDYRCTQTGDEVTL